MEIFSRIRVKTQIELVVPAKLETRFGQGIVPNLRPRVTLGQVGSVRGNLVRHDAVLHVFLVRQTQMLLGGDVAQHGSTIPANLCRTNSARNVVIARRNVGGQRPQGIERRFITMLELFVHVFFNQLHRYMSGPFYHNLDIMLPRYLGQFTQGTQFTHLRFIISIINAARSQTVAQTETDVIGFHDLANVLEMGIEEVLFVVRQTPFSHDGAPARHNAGHTFSCHGNER